MRTYQKILNFQVSVEELAMINAEARRREWTVSELVRVAIYQELLFTGNRDAYKLVGRKVRSVVSDKLKAALGLTDEEKLSKLRGSGMVKASDLRP